jgi:hypothetical protein
MSAPRLLIISFSAIRTDARVLKQVELFRERYSVTTCGYGDAPDGVQDHIEIPAALVSWKYPRATVVARAYSRAYWANPVVAYLRLRLPVGTSDVILANDIDAAGLALYLEPVHGVHLDLHEYSPRMKEEVLRWRLFMGPFMSWMIRHYASRVQSVSTVGQHIAGEYRRKFDLEISVVTNAAPFEDRAPSSVGDTVRLVHSGAAKPGRHLEIMLDAMDGVSRAATLDLYLTQNSGAYYEALRARIEGMRNVALHSPVAYKDLPAVLNDYDVGVFVLPPVNFNYRWTLPNKFFDFVQARLALVIGPSPEMASVLSEGGFGVVTRDFQASSLASTINSLTRADVVAFKEASHAAARRLSAEEEVKGWSRAIDTIAKPEAGL